LRPAVNPVLAIFTSTVAGGFLWFAASKTLEAGLARPTHDLAQIIGQIAETRTEVHAEGSVYLAGELWTARSAEPIPAGEQVRVVGREGFIVEVEIIRKETR
jgi:membrane-bound ClpP family serine protease